MIQLNLIEIFSIIIIHWVADFVLQTDKQAKGKSKNWSDLLSHTFVYTISFATITYFVGFFYLMITKGKIPFNINLLWFLPITFICHTITDYFTSRLNNKLWVKGDVHNFFVSIGFDQVLHYVQLFLTYALLKQYL